MTSSPKRFRIAISFPGEHRDFVSQVAERLAAKIGREKILYDRWHEAEFARPRLGAYLPRLYRDESELVTVFLCADYQAKEWCGLEWDAIFDLIKQRQDSAVMLLRFDNTEIAGLFSTHGYIWIANRPANVIADLILERLRFNSEQQTRLTKLPQRTASVVTTAALPDAGPSAVNREVSRPGAGKAHGNKHKRIAAMLASVVVAATLLLWASHRFFNTEGSKITSAQTQLPLKPVDKTADDNPAKSPASDASETIKVDPSESTNDPERFTLKGHEGPVSFVFTPDSQYLTSAGSVRPGPLVLSPQWGDGTLRLWDGKTGKEIRRLSSATLRINSLLPAPDGKACGAAIEDGTARIWTLPDGNESVIHREAEQKTTAVAFSPDSATLAVGTDKGLIKIFDWKAKKQLVECVGHGGMILRSGFFFSKDGSKLISASADNSIRVWDVATGRKRVTMPEWSDLWAVRRTYDPDRVVVIQSHQFGRNSVNVVDLVDEKVTKTFSVGSVREDVVSVDGKVVYTVGTAGLRAFDLDAVQEVCVDEKVCGTRFCFLPGNSRLVVTNELRLLVYKVDGFTFDHIRTEQEHTTPIISLAVSPDGAMVATGDESGIIKLWDARVLSQPKQK